MVDGIVVDRKERYSGGSGRIETPDEKIAYDYYYNKKMRKKGWCTICFWICSSKIVKQRKRIWN